MKQGFFIVCFILMMPYAHGQGIFGSIEFKAHSLKALPRWERVLEQVKKDQPVVAACDADISSCIEPSIARWRTFIKEQRAQPFKVYLKNVNIFVNKWPYITDVKLWGKSDYWAAPLEFLKHSGDCEDYAILKYMSLKELGVPVKNMRIVVVQDSIRDIAHAVLAVFVEDDILILDSLINATLSHKLFLQYTPYYSVNENSRWAHIMPIKKEK